MGRSMPSTSSGIIQEERLPVNGQEWTIYAVSGSPAQTVLHAILEIMSTPPDLVVSGINYGENVGLGVTISGTVGAAMEAASLGIPALAVSLEAAPQYHFSYSEQIDFTAAAHFTTLFARLLLMKKMPEDVHVLKVDVPAGATSETPWQITRLARQRYYDPVAPKRASWDVAGRVSYREAATQDGEPEDSDVIVLRRKRMVSVTPLSLDMTSRLALKDLEQYLRG